jgi:hypothetical protein
MNRFRFFALTLLTLPASCTAVAGTFSTSPFTGDGDSGINSTLLYTARADFNGPGTRVINGVSFTEGGASGANYSLVLGPNTFTGFANNVGGQSGQALTDFIYTGDGSGNASLTISGLTPGQTYVTSWYNSAFGGAGGRNITITASDTNTAIFFDENYTGDKNGNILRYAFTATASTITYNFDADGNADSFHHYAFTNAVANKALLATPTVTTLTGAGPFAPFTVRNDDLLQTHLAGVNSSGAASFQLEGGGGIPILSNGVFVISGGNPTDNSQLATVGNNAYIEFTLDTSVNAFGYDISTIETFGGWNDAGRDRQSYKILYSLVGSSDFLYLGGVDSNPAVTANPSAVRATFDTALTGVDAVRLEFFGGQENGYAGLGEVDVVGTASVPEPAVAGLLVLGLTSLAARRRRR